MRLGRRIAHRVRSLLRRARAESDMERELDQHLEQLVREHMAAGTSEADARGIARREFGPLEVIKEQCRDMRRVRLVDDLVRDLAYACRLLARSPGFTLTAVLSLALGIGANTAIFTLVDTVLLRTLPIVRAPRQLVEVSGGGSGTLSYPMYEIIRARNEVFSGALLLSSGRFSASARLGRIDAGDVRVSPVSGDYFSVLDVSPVIGRALNEEDLAAANATVIGYTLWQRAFGGDPGVLGKALEIGSRSYTIVGVAPAGFTGLATGHPVDLWVPITWGNWGNQQLTNRVAMMYRVIGRLRPGVSEAQAHANLELLARQWSADWNFDEPTQIEVTSASGGLTQLRRRFSRPLLVLMAVVALLLLIAAANVANLLLARASARQREMGVRLSLGATRGRLIRQLFAESCVLGGAGAVLGLLVAPAAAASLVRFLSSSMGTIDLSFSIDARVLAFTIVTSVAVVLLFGLAPALAATRLDLSPLSKSGTRVAGRGEGPVKPRKILVVAQVALSCVLLVGALLFARSLQTLTHVDAGFRPENVLLMQVRTVGGTAPERLRLFEQVLARLTHVPGVVAAAYSSESLFSGNSWTEAVSTPEFAPRPGSGRDAVLLVVSPGFFRTLGTAMLRGRDFDTRDTDHAQPVAIVNETMAREAFGDTAAVGRTFRLGDGPSPRALTVVGVVQDAKYRNLREAPTRLVYLPSQQMSEAIGAVSLAVRTTGNPEPMTDLLWKEIRGESSTLRFGGANTQARLVDGTIAQDRMLAQLSGFFSLTAAILVCLGLYGLTAYDVSRRTAEIGVRIALGAQRADVVRLVLKGSMVLVAIGVALGLTVAIGLARLVESLLFGVRGTDAITLLLSAGALLGVGAAAAYGPARRAARLDPIASLKQE